MDDFSSEIYWRNRYKKGRNSGAGSYGRLAVYKAHIINQITYQNAISSVLELGCGDGYQASLFDIVAYTGVDVSPHCVHFCQDRFKDREGWSFELTGNFVPSRSFQMVMSLDVIYHLVEDSVFEDYMSKVVACAQDWILIYSSNHEAAGSTPHVRHRSHEDWITQNAPEFEPKQEWLNPFKASEIDGTHNTSFADFTLYQRAV